MESSSLSAINSRVLELQLLKNVEESKRRNHDLTSRRKSGSDEDELIDGDWGSYSKTYVGISHVHPQEGLRFDVSVFPGLYRRRVDPPAVCWESSYHPWRASSKLGQFVSFRHDVEWKDKVYCDISYSHFPLSSLSKKTPSRPSSSSSSSASSSGQLIRCELVNQTSLSQSLVLHFMLSLNFPPLQTNSPKVLSPSLVSLSASGSGFFIHPLDYTDLQFSHPKHTDHLVYDGQFRGEIRGNDFVEGAALGQGFGLWPGDQVLYEFQLSNSIEDAVLLLRYKVLKSEMENRRTEEKEVGEEPFSCSSSLTFYLEGIYEGTVIFEEQVGIQDKVVSLERSLPSKEKLRVKLTSQEGGAHSLILVGLVICSKDDLKEVKFVTKKWNPVPRLIFSSSQVEDEKQKEEEQQQKKKNNSRFIIKYDDVLRYYGICWSSEEDIQFEIREILNSELDRFLRYKAHNHVDKVLKGDEEGHFTNVFLRPIHLRPSSKRTLFGFVCQGSTKKDVVKMLNYYQSVTPTELEDLYNSAASTSADFSSSSTPPSSSSSSLAGRTENTLRKRGREGQEKYGFSQTLLASTLLTNVVFPVYTRRQFIRHHTPGRWWDSLYTWDSGFIGLGLLHLDPLRAFDCLATYLVEPNEIGVAFIHHGSMVPVQAYLFFELWNRIQSLSFLKWSYTRLRYYYSFFVGREGTGSKTRTLKSNLLKTWDYFYNSGGWDDYPAQVEVHRRKMEALVTPVLTTAHAIRFAKIMKMAAQHLSFDSETKQTAGKAEEARSWKEHMKEYEEDIKMFTTALVSHTWDEEEGYFSYLIHNEEGTPQSFLRDTGSGKNLNMGLDGVSPLVSGVCSSQQEKRLFGHLSTEGRLWSKIGLSAVDLSAPYFKNDGYWNGTVWFPHQWFFWKSFLDSGNSELSWRIARTALKVYERETKESYNCFEHFVIETGRGAGWHQFGGLSSPIISWYHSYFVPGNFTTGFNVWILSSKFSEELDAFDATLEVISNTNEEEEEEEEEQRNFVVLVCLKNKNSQDSSRQMEVKWTANENQAKEEKRTVTTTVWREHSCLLEISIPYPKCDPRTSGSLSIR